jgi:hypothetical protein
MYQLAFTAIQTSVYEAYFINYTLYVWRNYFCSSKCYYLMPHVSFRRVRNPAEGLLISLSQSVSQSVCAPVRSKAGMERENCWTELYEI